ncbi:hypothetical protein SRHO_G00171160 [Serrasalmus rhombeus]
MYSLAKTVAFEFGEGEEAKCLSESWETELCGYRPEAAPRRDLSEDVPPQMATAPPLRPVARMESCAVDRMQPDE